MEPVKDLIAPIKTICDLAGKLLGPAADEFGLYLGDRVRIWRQDNILRVLQRTDQRLEGLHHESVDPKFLFQVMEKASFEKDDFLQEKWANLLSSAALGKEPVLSFVSTLSQLSPVEARVLDRIYHSREEYLCWGELPGAHLENVLRPDESEIHIQSLERLGLVMGQFPREWSNWRRKLGGSEVFLIYLTHYAVNFLKCCSGNRAEQAD